MVEVFSSTDDVIGNGDDVSRGVAITDENGHYTLGGLIDGINYYLVFRPGGGKETRYSFTTQDAGDDDQPDSDPNASGVTELFTLSPGQSDTSLDAGLLGSSADFG